MVSRPYAIESLSSRMTWPYSSATAFAAPRRHLQHLQHLQHLHLYPFFTHTMTKTTIAAMAIKMYCNGVLMADYPFTNGGANTTYRASVLSAIAQMQYFVLGADTALLGWGNPYMTVQRAMLYDFAMTEAEVEELFSNGLYLHRVQAGGNICGTAADMAKRAVADGVGNVISETYAKSEDVPDIPTPTSLYNGYFLGVSGGAYALRGVQKTVYEHNVQIVLEENDQYTFRCTVLSSSPTALTVSGFLAALAACPRAAVGFLRNTGGVTPSISIIYEAYRTSVSDVPLGIRCVSVTNLNSTSFAQLYEENQISITDNVRAITI